MSFYSRLKLKLNKNSPIYQSFPMKAKKIDSPGDKFFSPLPINPSWKEKIREQYQEYENYIQYYLPLYKKLVLEELQTLSLEFPDIEFEFQIRIKARNSMHEKVIRKLKEGKSGTIYDIFAHKIILCSCAGNESEEKLVPLCYQVADFLSSFDPNSVELIKKRKDYISTPKDNNYQSIHVLKKHFIHQTSFYTERQVKTLQMRLNEMEGTASHANVYKDRFSVLATSANIQDHVPNYLSFILDERHIPITVIEQPFADSFYHFFHIPFEEYQKAFKNKEQFSIH